MDLTKSNSNGKSNEDVLTPKSQSRSNDPNPSNILKAPPSTVDKPLEPIVVKSNEPVINPPSQVIPIPQAAPIDESLKLGSIPSTEGLDAVMSDVSLGFGMPIATLDMPQVEIKNGPEPYTTLLRTACAYAIRCVHARMLLQLIPTRGALWLPFAYANDDEKYSATVDSIYKMISDDMDSLNKT